MDISKQVGERIRNLSIANGHSMSHLGERIC